LCHFPLSKNIKESTTDGEENNISEKYRFSPLHIAFQVIPDVSHEIRNRRHFCPARNPQSRLRLSPDE